MAAQLSSQAVLIFFCGIQFLTYFDRGALSGLLSYAEYKWHLSGSLSGLLGSSYFLSVMIVAPLIAGALVRASVCRQMYAIAFGSLMWAVAAICCGVAQSYSVLLIGRIISGLGEAAYCVFASPIIDDAAPSGSKSRFLGTFYSLVYVATGVGFVAPSYSKDWDSGSIIFVVEAVMMLPFVVFAFVYADRFQSSGVTEATLLRQYKAVEIQGELQRIPSGFQTAVTQTWQVLSVRQYSLFLLGYCALVFALNGMNFWGPTYMEQVLHLTKSQGSLQLGAAVVFGGLGGSAVGGMLLDRITHHKADSVARAKAAAKVCCLSAILSLPFGMVALATRSSLIFLCFATLYIFFLTCSTAPCTVGMMEAVPVDCRGIAMGLSSFGCHIFGDCLSPVVVGFLADESGSLVLGMWVLVLWSIPTALFWGLAIPTSEGAAAVHGTSMVIQHH